ncbi:nephrocystin-3 [Aspergillus udagawae]|nr:nephrocystin-3 [Aspergillus udagawae]
MLRLCPVATTGPRRMADGDVKYRDFVIPKGTILLANLNALHWDPERFGVTSCPATTSPLAPAVATPSILERNPARSRLIQQSWEQAQKDGYILRGVHVDADGGVRGGAK